MIITLVSQNYANWLDVFMESLKITNPNEKVWIEMVNCNEETINKIKSYDQIHTVVVTRKPEPVSGGWFVNHRIDMAMDILKNNNVDEKYLVCDIDLLFRKSIQPIWDGLSDNTMGIVFRDGYWQGIYYEHLRVNAGIIAFRKDSYDFFAKWKEVMDKFPPRMHGVDKGGWYFDQLTLWMATQQYDTKYFRMAPEIYVNREFYEDAIIWFANLEPKSMMYTGFCKELERMKQI